MVKYKFWRKWNGHGDHSATERIVRNSGHKRSLRRGGIIQVEISNKGLLSRKTFAKLYCLIDGHSLLFAKNSESVDKKCCVKLDLSKAKGFHVFQTVTRGSVTLKKGKTLAASPFIEIVDQSRKNFRLYFTNDEQFDYWREPLNRIFYKYYMYPRKNSCEFDQYSTTSGDEVSNVEVANSSDSTEYKDVGSENHVESNYDPESKSGLAVTNYKNHPSIKNSVISPPGTMDEERLRLENEAYECELIHRSNMLKQRRVNLKNQLGLELSLADGDDDEESQLAPTDPTLKSEFSSNMDNENPIDDNMNDSGISKEITPDLTPIEKYSRVFEFGDNRPINDKNNVPHTVSVSGSSESGVVCRESPDGVAIPVHGSKILNQCPNSPNSDRLSNCSTCDIVPKLDNQNTPQFSVPLYPIPFTKMVDKSTSVGGSCLSLANFIQKSNQISPQKIFIPPRSPLSPYRRQEYNEAKCAAKKLFFSNTRLLKPNDLWPKYASCENLRQSSSFQKDFTHRIKCRIDSVDDQTQNIVSSTPFFDRENANFSRSQYAVTPLYCGNSMKSNRNVSTYHASLAYGPMPYKTTVKIGHSAQPTKVAFGDVRDVGDEKNVSEFPPLDNRCCRSTTKKSTTNDASPVPYIYTPANITCKLCRT